jgi:hypothetical protein
MGKNAKMCLLVRLQSPFGSAPRVSTPDRQPHPQLTWRSVGHLALWVGAAVRKSLLAVHSAARLAGVCVTRGGTANGSARTCARGARRG